MEEQVVIWAGLAQAVRAWDQLQFDHSAGKFEQARMFDAEAANFPGALQADTPSISAARRCVRPSRFRQAFKSTPVIVFIRDE
jgi:hypothetical protein